jgi:hypothetical protein
MVVTIARNSFHAILHLAKVVMRQWLAVSAWSQGSIRAGKPQSAAPFRQSVRQAVSHVDIHAPFLVTVHA